MKNVFLLLILSLIYFNGCKTTKPVAEIRQEPIKSGVTVTDASEPAINFSDQSTWLLGYINPRQLTREPYSTWYLKGYNDYQPDKEIIKELLNISKEDLSIKIVLGTWCSDSRREVPRFMRIIDLWQFPPGDIVFIGVDDVKISPLGEYDKLDIQRVPTFIIYNKNIETGRIIENPKTSLEQDLVNILTRNE